MKTIYYIGVAIFTIGIALFFTRQFKPDFLPFIDDHLIDFMWPIGLLVLSLSQAKIKKSDQNDE